MPTKTLVATATLMLAACAEPTPVATATPTPIAAATPAPTPAPVPAPSPSAAAAAPALAIDGEGLRLVDMDSGRARPIPFGTSQADTLAALAWRGAPERGETAECGAGPVATAQWRDGVLLTFQDGRFAGWSVDRRSGGKVTNMAGIGPGSTRAEIEEVLTLEMVPDSTLGTEFTTGGMGGLLDGTGPSARVTDLWAGVTCMAR